MKKIMTVLALFALVTVSSPKTASADGSDAVMAQLSKIEEKQAEILQKLDEVMAELQIVKVRATLRS